MTNVIMPRLSDSMEQGTIAKWLKATGDTVARGEPLVEIDTDKATVTWEAEATGVLKIQAHEGQTLAIGEVIANIGDNGPLAGAREYDKPSVSDASRPTLSDEAPSHTSRPRASGEAARVNASPVAVRIAQELGIDLASVKGTGPGGRIVKNDVEVSAGETARSLRESTTSSNASVERARRPVAGYPPDAASPRTDDQPAAKGAVRTEEMTHAQQVIARRMSESRATIPNFALQAEVDMEACVELHQEARGPVSSIVPTYTDMVVKACAIALREFPRANSSYRDDHLEMHSRVNVGVAVDAKDVLLVPTIFDADQKPLLTIAAEIRTLSEQARVGALTPAELSGATFTVSNLGMHCIRSFEAIVNPPQAAILAVGSVEQRPVVRSGEITVRHNLSLTLSCDHRVIYGAEAARFLTRIRSLLEEPSALTQ